MKSFGLISAFNRNLIINFLISLFPLSFIIGNLAININIVLIILFGSSFYFNQIYKVKFSLFEKLIILFFIYILFTGLWNYFERNNFSFDGDSTIAVKSIYFLRFLFLILVLNFLIRANIFNFKWFFVSCLFFTFFVSLDIIYQYFFLQDIFGFKVDISPEDSGIARRLSGPFGDEYIAGSYLQRFSIFGLCCLPFFYKIKKPYSLIILLSLFVTYWFSLILSGNRMPVILFLFTIFLILLFEKETRKNFIYFVSIVIIVFSSLYLTNDVIKKHFNNFKSISTRIANVLLIDVGVKNGNLSRSDIPSHYQEFRSFYETWKMNKYIGGGIKSFRINCPQRKIINSYERIPCNIHPHNYYLEILSEIGLIGFILFLSILLFGFYNSLLRYNNKVELTDKLLKITSFILMGEMMPLRSSGSFFTTGNAAFIFLVLAILLASRRKI